MFPCFPFTCCPSQCTTTFAFDPIRPTKTWRIEKKLNLTKICIDTRWTNGIRSLVKLRRVIFNYPIRLGWLFPSWRTYRKVQLCFLLLLGLLIATRTASWKRVFRFSPVNAEHSMKVPSFLLSFNPSAYVTCKREEDYKIFFTSESGFLRNLHHLVRLFWCQPWLLKTGKRLLCTHDRSEAIVEEFTDEDDWSIRTVVLQFRNPFRHDIVEGCPVIDSVTQQKHVRLFIQSTC